MNIDFMILYFKVNSSRAYLNVAEWPGGGEAGHVCLNRFSAKFPIGLHVILKVQMKKSKFD